MSCPLSRRQFLWSTAAALYPNRSAVSLIPGGNRRENVFNALVSIDDQIQPLLRAKKTVLIKPNVVVARTKLAATHIDALAGILDYLRGKAQWKGPVVIAESSAEDTREGFAYNEYTRLSGVTLVDLNLEGSYAVHNVVDQNLHVQPVRLAARLLDPDAFVICPAMLKTHDRVVATLSIKNMAMGAPLHSPTPVNWAWQWNDKPKMHDTHRLANVNICQVAQRLKPFWGVAVIDGYEGMEGNGPSEGTPVASHLAIASTDFLAADRVGLECMGIDASLVGYLNYAAELGLGQYDLANIDIRDGVSPASVKRTYTLHRYIQDELQWQRPFPACSATGTLTPSPRRGQ